MRRKSLLTLLSTAVLVAGTGTSLPIASAIAAPTKAAANQKFTNNAYIVQLAEAPVSAYRGGIKGLQATRPGKGQKIDPNSPAVINYMAFLESRQNEVLAKVGGGKKLHSYGYVFSGFAAELSAEQAAKLKQMPGVLAVTKDEARELNTSSTPDFLGLTAPGGAWSEVKGEGVIIGIVDGGIWPESLSFSDRTGTNGNASKDGKLSYQQIPGWNGRCVPGEAFNASHCNQKLIGARYYNAGWGGNAGIDAQLPWEYNSPRDFGGHGTHTASTAGGNENVPMSGANAVFGSINGIAPRARIAAYKVCWETGTGGSCFNSDSVAAIDQAVADGVDVINFSISGSQTSVRDPVEVAFLFAADAGVFVAASAGNSGPTSSTVAHPSPWLTTVAAGTHDRNFDALLTLGDGSTATGSSVNQVATGPAPYVYAGDVGLPGADLTRAKLCYSSADGGNVLDPTKVAGKIVLCDRGDTARVNKSLAVKEAGGIGMVLANVSPGTLNAEVHSVPTVHVADTLRAGLLVYAQSSGATAQIGKSYFAPVAAPFTASFSSRGPSRAANGDVLKPDLIAPGQDILAAVAPPGNGGESFASYQGTSMSSPHVAGLAALLKEKYPTWSPMMIKSALMTTGSDTILTPQARNSSGIIIETVANDDARLIFRQGAGHVQPNSALNPGLVYNSDFGDWLSFLCGAQPGNGCSGVTPMDPSNLNQASIAIGDMAGVQTVKRRVTNVSNGPLSVSATLTGMAGFTTVVSPDKLDLKRGETKEFTVTFTRTTATLNAYTGGQLTWTGGGYSVRSPIVVRPVALAAPTLVSSNGSPTSYNVTFGYTGPFSATPRGLVAADITNGMVDQDPDQTFVQGDTAGTVAIPVVIPAGTTYTRFSLFNADVTTGTDIDLFVYLGTSLVGSSTNGGSNEEVNFSFANPTASPIALTVYIHGWGVVGGTTPFALHAWYLGANAAGNMSVAAPASATIGASGTISLSFSGLDPGMKYLGSVAYSGAAGMPSPTIVRVDTP